MSTVREITVCSNGREQYFCIQSTTKCPSKMKFCSAVIFTSIFLSHQALGQDIPLVYKVEHTGASFPKPPMVDYEKLPSVRPLPDPFGWSDGSGRSSKFDDWQRRRAEIKSEIERYGIGVKPPTPENLLRAMRMVC